MFGRATDGDFYFCAFTRKRNRQLLVFRHNRLKLETGNRSERFSAQVHLSHSEVFCVWCKWTSHAFQSNSVISFRGQRRYAQVARVGWSSESAKLDLVFTRAAKYFPQDLGWKRVRPLSAVSPFESHYWEQGGDWGDRPPPPKTYKSKFFHHNFVQFGKQHSRYKAILTSIVLSQQCCEVYFMSLAVMNGNETW